MSFDDRVTHIQEVFHRSEFDTVNEPYPLDQVAHRKKVAGCVLLARRECFEVIYAEVESNPESISGDLARSHLTPCLVITRMGTAHVFTATDNDTLKPIHAKAAEGKEARLWELVKYVGSLTGDLWESNLQLVGFINTMRDF